MSIEYSELEKKLIAIEKDVVVIKEICESNEKLIIAIILLTVFIAFILVI